MTNAMCSSGSAMIGVSGVPGAIRSHGADSSTSAS
jgi:hypothetical protein